jgi:hypothetical protein
VTNGQFGESMDGVPKDVAQTIRFAPENAVPDDRQRQRWQTACVGSAGRK